MKRLMAAVTAVVLLCPVCRAAEIPRVSAASAILVDAGSGRILYEKDAYTQRLIASTTKLMTALVAVETTPDLEKKFTMTPEYQAEGSSMYLKFGEEVTLRELLYGLLLASGNDAALVIAGGCGGEVAAFVDQMNRRAEELGMQDTHFVNPNGLDHKEHYSTAYDMTLLARAVLQNETLREIVATHSAMVAGRSLTNHNKLLWRYEGCGGMKTGYTEAAGRTLVSCATRNGQTLVCVTLKDPDDWDDHAALFDYGFSAFSAQTLAQAGTEFKRLPVTGGLIPQVGVVAASDVAYPLTDAEQPQVRIDLPERAKAPVRKGGRAGKLTFLLGEEQIGETELLYAADIPDATCAPTLLERIKAFLRDGRGRSSLAALFLKRG